MGNKSLGTKIKTGFNIKLNVKKAFPQAKMIPKEKMYHKIPTYEKLGFSKKDAVQIFLDHAYLTRAAIIEKYGFLDEYDGDKTKAKSAAWRVFEIVSRNPDDFAYYVDKETIDTVSAMVSERQFNQTPVPLRHDKKLLEKLENSQDGNSDVKRTVISNLQAEIEDSIASLLLIIQAKIDATMSRKGIKEAKFNELINAFDKFFGYMRLLQGQSTENVAVMVKEEGLDKLSSEELIKIMNKTRLDLQARNSENNK